MIKLVHENGMLIDYLIEDSIVNYFILLTLEREKYEELYESKWIQFDDYGNMQAVLLKRKTGNIQFFSKSEYNAEEFGKFLGKISFNKLIGERSVLAQLLFKYKFSSIEENSYIAMLKQIDIKYSDISFKSSVKDYEFREINVNDIDEIINLYKKVFKGFSTKQSMIDKLSNKSGRGYCIAYKGKIICTVQSSFEQNNSAIIVGVATLPEYRKRGFARSLTYLLCKELLEEGKICYLQYDNLEAGRIYKQIGFKDVGRMLMCYNR